MTNGPLLGPLGARLALAFTVVALGAIGLLTGLTIVAAQGDVSSLYRQQQADTLGAVTEAAATAYTEVHGWPGADLSAAEALASETGAGLTVLDGAGKPVTSVPGPAAGGFGSSRASAVIVDGARVGTAVLRFSDTGLPNPDRRLRDALVRSVAIGAGLAAALALGVTFVVSRRLTRPIVALTGVARAMERGDRDARVVGRRGPGELSELAGAFNEMADSLAREDALRRSLVADVAHELRTPVTVLQASTEALRDGVVEPTASQLSSLHDEVLRLETMVEDLETLSSAEAAGLRLERRPVDLAEVARRCVEALRPRFEAAGVEVTSTLREAVVAGDPGRLGQVATNLLANAMKFTPPGGRVTVKVGEEGDVVRLEVSDTGVGITAEDADHVFERFWRGSQATGTTGSGIGLAVVAELVRAHGGAVRVSSVPGEGSSFVVTLPRAARES